MDMKKVYVPKGEEKLMQRALLQFSDPVNHDMVIKALKKASRTDLIGFGPEALVRPRLLKNEKTNQNTTRRKENNNELSDFRRKKSVTESKRRVERKGSKTKRGRH